MTPIAAGDGLASGNLAELAFDFRGELGGVEVADRDQERIRGMVEVAVVAVEVVAGDAAQVGLVADDHVAVGVGMKRGSGDLFVQGVAGVVFRALALGEDHGAFRFDFVGIKERVDHAIGLDAQRQRDLVGWHGFEVGRPVVRGERVEGAADAGDIAEDAALFEGRGALELHVLDPVGEAGLARMLVAAADAIPGPERGDGGGVVLFEEELHPVRESGFEDLG